MEAKIEVINGHNVIRTEHWSLTEDNNLLRTSAHFKLDDNDLDELYAVLHARHVAQQYDKTIISRIEKAVRNE